VSSSRGRTVPALWTHLLRSSVPTLSPRALTILRAIAARPPLLTRSLLAAPTPPPVLRTRSRRQPVQP
jgi:hypothetical protein